MGELPSEGGVQRVDHGDRGKQIKDCATPFAVVFPVIAIMADCLSLVFFADLFDVVHRLQRVPTARLRGDRLDGTTLGVGPCNVAFFFVFVERYSALDPVALLLWPGGDLGEERHMNKCLLPMNVRVFIDRYVAANPTDEHRAAEKRPAVIAAVIVSDRRYAENGHTTALVHTLYHPYTSWRGQNSLHTMLFCHNHDIKQ